MLTSCGPFYWVLLSNAPCEKIIISSATLAAQNPLKHHLSLPCEGVPHERWYKHWFSENKEENDLPKSKYKFQESHAPLLYFVEHIANLRIIETIWLLLVKLNIQMPFWMISDFIKLYPKVSSLIFLARNFKVIPNKFSPRHIKCHLLVTLNWLGRTMKVYISSYKQISE